MSEEQIEELDVLKSIYDGDENFSVIQQNIFQYKYGDDEAPGKSFIIEIRWGPNYPNETPEINMDLFYNKHIMESVKKQIVEELSQQAQLNLGMSMTFTLFEWLKEAKEDLLAAQMSALQLNETANGAESDSEDASTSQDSVHESAVKKKQKQHLTKSQKKKMWDRQEAGGQKPRGADWVDIIKHLSQTGSGPP